MTKKLKISDILKITRNKKIEIGLILGSGLGQAIPLKEKFEFDYSDLDGFCLPSVTGHTGKLLIGTTQKQSIAILSGRTHFYENGKPDTMRNPIQFLKHLGVKKLILTNAAGSLRENIPTGSIMVIKDHINFSGLNPLIGENSDKRFVNLTLAYDKEINKLILESGIENNIRITEGIYAWFSGPSFETPAEINAVKYLGADVVGMSTVPEVILSRFFDIKVSGISVITNMAAGLSNENISHKQTKEIAKLNEKKLRDILISLLRKL